MKTNGESKFSYLLIGLGLGHRCADVRAGRASRNAGIATGTQLNQ